MEKIDKSSFDLDRLSRKMPYAVSPDLFERLPNETMAKILAEDESQARRAKGRFDISRRVVRSAVVALTSIAAVIAFLLIFDMSTSTSSDMEAELDGIVAKLSDEELEQLVSEVDNSYEFYTNL